MTRQGEKTEKNRERAEEKGKDRWTERKTGKS